MRFCSIAALSFLFAIYSASGAKIVNNTTDVRTKTNGETVVCNQYIVQDANPHEAIKKLDEKLSKKLDQLIKLLQPGSTNPGPDASSCKEIYDKNLSKGNRAYLLKIGSRKIPVYCHMTSAGLGACGGGGWTLAMKIDGSKRTFRYDSKLWSNKIDFNLPGGKTGLDIHETKLPTYWNTHFSKICLGMRIGHQIRFIVVNKHANSLYSVIAGGKYHAISLGRKTWMNMIGSQASLQPNCNMEGFNAACTYSIHPAAKARIGFLGNGENDCITCDSRIGFGMAGLPSDTNTCGNEAEAHVHVEAMGYILVQ